MSAKDSMHIERWRQRLAHLLEATRIYRKHLLAEAAARVKEAPGLFAGDVAELDQGEMELIDRLEGRTRLIEPLPRISAWHSFQEDTLTRLIWLRDDVRAASALFERAQASGDAGLFAAHARTLGDLHDEVFEVCFLESHRCKERWPRFRGQ